MNTYDVRIPDRISPTKVAFIRHINATGPEQLRRRAPRAVAYRTAKTAAWIDL
jgi:hypothetical protein